MLVNFMGVVLLCMVLILKYSSLFKLHMSLVITKYARNMVHRNFEMGNSVLIIVPFSIFLAISRGYNQQLFVCI